jgi:penicillin V acylase-like amidase (Ntn superfamily)
MISLMMTRKSGAVAAVWLVMFVFLECGAAMGAGRSGQSSGPVPDRQCTSFCLDVNGYAVFGANYDYGKDLHQGLIFVNKRNVVKSFWELDPASAHARWTSKYGSVSFNLVMSQLSWAGMNEAGLVISTLELAGSRPPAPDSRPWIYSNYWLQYILDNCATIEEVIASDAAVRIKEYVDHYLVCDKKGRCATIEFIDGKMVWHAGADLPVKALANSSYDASVAEWNEVKIRRSHGRLALPTHLSLRRFVLAADRMTAFKAGDTESAVQYAFDTLDEVSGQSVKGSPTLWSIVFDTHDLRIYFRTIVHHEVRWINLQNLDFSCRTPVKMMDINERLQGDVTSRLKDYSFQIHFDHAFAGWKRWGNEVDAASLEKNIRFFEQLPCADSAELKRK